ncbi:LysR substrate-binding domain-containing protein [Jeongeupia naejangsanensis]|uniref:LysR family transcriptional regulator n=1 Tax=Jeongeupia naejangsanensis TaxID=613195 RepID=A0ABS2BMV6_9NEIS|nr:LysR substrate-binding domain-containing protein [Jeongeupia naejangsanensis]MBM3116956.1 LysR family transcriptional regulator [Jeongeupia naejangsanensis]
MRRVHFDLDVLRCFVTGVELGSFAKAADRLGRSTSAVSAQLKKLEDQAGTPVLRKSGRRLVLTDAGETLLAYARRLLALNDAAADALHGMNQSSEVRLGLPEDFGESLLPQLLGQFARANPDVRLDVTVGRNAALMKGIDTGQLDVALSWDDGTPARHAERLGTVPMCWIGPADADRAWQAGAALPLVAFEAPCLMRSAAADALDHAGIAWRIAFTSTSLAGIWSAVGAGLGLAVRTPLGLPERVRRLDAAETGLPALPALDLRLLRAEADPAPAVRGLQHMLQQALAGWFDATPGGVAAGLTRP